MVRTYNAATPVVTAHADDSKEEPRKGKNLEDEKVSRPRRERARVERPLARPLARATPLHSVTLRAATRSLKKN